MDREARHTRKSKSKRRDGFRGHVAAEPETGLITDCGMTMAAGPGSTDAENGVKMAARDRFARRRCHPGRGTRRRQTMRNQGDAAAGGLAGRARQAGRGEPADAAGRRRSAGRQDGAGQDAREGGGLEVYGDSAYGSGEARAAYRDGGHDTVIKPGPLRPAVPGGFTAR